MTMANQIHSWHHQWIIWVIAYQFFLEICEEFNNLLLIYFIFKLESNNSTNGHHCKNECGQNGLFQGVQGYYSWCYIDEFESWDYCTPNQEHQGVKGIARDRGMNLSMDIFIYGRNCFQIFFGDLPT